VILNNIPEKFVKNEWKIVKKCLGIYGTTLLTILLYKLKLIYIINNTTLYTIEK